MGDGSASVAQLDQVAPSDGALVDDVATKKPADEAARSREALRAKRRRLEAKLKGAKSEAQMNEMLRTYLGDKAPAEAEAVGIQLPAPTEPGQRPGWPPPSKVAETEGMLVAALAGTAEVAETLLGKADAQDPAILAALTVAACLKADPGRQLAAAWAPLVTLYAPAWLNTPHAAAALGTLHAGGLILASVKATLDAQHEQLAAKKKAEAEAKKQEPAT